MRRPLPIGPVVLVPPSAQHPFARLGHRCTLPYTSDDLLVAGRPSQIDDLQALSKSDEVAMRVVQPWNDRRLLRVDDTRVLASPLQDSVVGADRGRSEEHTSELQSQSNLVCRLLLEKKNNRKH